MHIRVAEYAVLGVLAAAKRFDQVVRLQDQRQWPSEPPGRTELSVPTGKYSKIIALVESHFRLCGEDVEDLRILCVHMAVRA
jgi:hypothetical protein